MDKSNLKTKRCPTGPSIGLSNSIEMQNTTVHNAPDRTLSVLSFTPSSVYPQKRNIKRKTEESLQRQATTKLDVAKAPSNSNANNTERAQAPQNDEECVEIIRILEGHMNVHAEQAGDYIKGHDDRSKECDLAENLVGPGALVDTIDRQLGEIIAVGAREDLLKVAQVSHHGDDVILDITKIQTNVHPWRDPIILVATLGKAL